MRISTVRIRLEVNVNSRHSVRTTVPGCDYMIETPEVVTVYEVDVEYTRTPGELDRVWKVATHMGWAYTQASKVFTFIIPPDSARLHKITNADEAAALVKRRLDATPA